MPADLADTLETWPDDLPTRLMVLVPESVQQIPVADDGGTHRCRTRGPGYLGPSPCDKTADVNVPSRW